jgi:hypothetical protein
MNRFGKNFFFAGLVFALLILGVFKFAPALWGETSSDLVEGGNTPASVPEAVILPPPLPEKISPDVLKLNAATDVTVVLENSVQSVLDQKGNAVEVGQNFEIKTVSGVADFELVSAHDKTVILRVTPTAKFLTDETAVDLEFYLKTRGEDGNERESDVFLTVEK